MRLALLCLACWYPDPRDGVILCGPESDPCPDGYYCAPDRTCWIHPYPDLGLDSNPPDLTTVELGAPVHVTVRRTGFTPDQGRVTGTMLDCGTSCDLMVPAGTPIDLYATVTPKMGAWFSGYSGPCGKMPHCRFAPVSDVTINAQFDHANYVFVTSTKLTLPFGNTPANVLFNADSFCIQRAMAGKLPNVEYRAWLSVSGTGHNAIDRLGNFQGWIRPDGTPFANTLPVGSSPVYYPPRLDENGNDVGEVPVLTGSNVSGTLDTSPNGNCSDFTSTSGTSAAGLSDKGVMEWGSQLTVSCSTASFAIYCFEYDYTSQIVPPPAETRLAFLSRNAFDPSTGLSGGNLLCQLDASNAGLASPDKFLAVLGTTSAAAMTLFDTSGAPWSRTDGVLLAPTAAGFFTSPSLLAPLDLQADGVTYAPSGTDVITGGPAASPAPSLDDSCNDWLSMNRTGDVGNADYSDGHRFDTMTRLSCNTNFRVYCLEN
jgi:hypothetical protein